jgi:hypothetical protein
MVDIDLDSIQARADAVSNYELEVSMDEYSGKYATRLRSSQRDVRDLIAANRILLNLLHGADQ